VFTDKDLAKEIEKMPPSARESMDDTEKKTDLLKNVIAERLLIDKAAASNWTGSRVQDQLAHQADALLVRSSSPMK